MPPARAPREWSVPDTDAERLLARRRLRHARRRMPDEAIGASTHRDADGEEGPGARRG